MASVIYIDGYLRELGYLDFADGDFTIGVSNSFSIKAPANLGIERGYYLAIDGSEFGGRVDGYEYDTRNRYITLTGSTWQGILERNLVKPNPGQTHYTVSGEANAVIGNLIARLGLGFCMAAEMTSSGFTISSYSFSRLPGNMGGYTGCREMLNAVGAKLKMKYDSAIRRVVLSAVAQDDYFDNGIDGDKQPFVIRETLPVNHLHCMGAGEGTSRITLDLYSNEEGIVSKTQTIFGAAHNEKDYVNTNCSSLAELEEEGTRELQALQKDRISCSIPGINDGSYDIDDIVGARSTKLNRYAKTFVAAKIATINARGKMRYETKTALEIL